MLDKEVTLPDSSFKILSIYLAGGIVRNKTRVAEHE